MGPFSEALAGMTADDADRVAGEMAQRWDTLPAEAMYVLAVRLFEVGRPDDAVYWFYAAQMRARVLSGIVADPPAGENVGDPGFELMSALGAFFELAGPAINTHAFRDLPALQETLGRVLEDSAPVPRFAELHPALWFVPAERWPEAHEGGLQGLVSFRQQLAEAEAERNEEPPKDASPEP